MGTYRSWTARRTTALGRTLTPMLAAALLAGGCRDIDDSDDGDGGAEHVSIDVDDSLSPYTDELPAVDGAERPLATLVDQDGTQVDFVEDELLVSTDDPEVLAAFLDRWDGTLVESLDGGDADLAGLPGLHRIRVDTSIADTTRLEADVAALAEEGGGRLQVSSEAGLRLLAAAAAEQRDGLSLAVNWVAKPHAFVDQDCQEAPAGPGGYSPNAYDWSYLAAGGNQDIGVTEAWRALEFSGEINNEIDVAIIDVGFEIDEDFPPGTQAHSANFGVDATGTPYGGGYRWHGTATANVIGAVPDNDYGSVGVAGPVVGDLVLVRTSLDFYSATSALVIATNRNVDIISMSFSFDVPMIVAWTLAPFAIATDVIRGDGTLLFASAGNEGTNVDSEYIDALGTSWGEKTWHSPCENAGVICVGGLGWDSTDRDPSSNYGSKNVDIFAPYYSYVGPDPDHPGNTARSFSGTSSSSPYAAGVAALIWATDPSMSAGNVEGYLKGRAHTSSDPKVERYVNAYGPVAELLGELEPWIEIVTPPDGSTFPGGHPVYFEAEAVDMEDETPEILWLSSENFILGSGLSVEPPSLDYGTHLITATAFDKGGNMVTTSITVFIENYAPEVEIIQPATGSQFFVNETVELRGSSSDYNAYPDLVLADDEVLWQSSLDGVLGNGHEMTVNLSQGSHEICFIAQDDGGAMAQDCVTIQVDPEPVDQPPAVSITSPATDVVVNGPDWLDWQYDGYDYGAGMLYKDVYFVGTAIDPEDGALTGGSVVWTTDRTDLQSAQIGTGTSGTFRLHGTDDSETHVITVTATDSYGHARTEQRVIHLWAVF